MYKFNLFILIYLFIYLSCNTSSVSQEEKQPDLNVSQKNLNKLAFINSEGFLPSNCYKIEYIVRGCFEYETQTIQFMKEPDGSIVAVYYVLNTNDNVKKGFSKKTINNNITNEMNNLIAQCKEADKKETNDDSIISFTKCESITISDGLHFKTYSFDDRLKFNPFIALKDNIFSEIF